MKAVVAVEADGETISKTFARSPMFLVTVDGKKVKTIKNLYTEAMPAGPPAAELVAKENPDMVVCQNFGPVAEEVLRKKGIKIVKKSTLEELANDPPGRSFYTWLREKLKWQTIMIVILALATGGAYVLEKRKET